MNLKRIELNRSASGVAIAIALAMGLGACATTPQETDRLVAARSAVQRAAAQGDPTGPAKADLDTAQTNLAQAEAALKKGKPAKEVDNFAYIAEQSAMAAIARNDSAALQKRVEAAEGERSKVLLEARERDAKMAQHKAETAEAEAARVQQIARQQSAALTQQSAALNQQSNELNQQQAELQRKQQELQAANALIEELKAQKTDRGIVLTLGDVLFDTGSATLKAGADRSLQQVAAYLQRNEKARLLIEGHTDSVGDDAYNQSLSQSRAMNVQGRLATMGIPNARMTASGLGEAYPVTGNDTAPGRQQNRRVEIIFSDNAGDFPAAAQRTLGR